MGMPSPVSYNHLMVLNIVKYLRKTLMHMRNLSLQVFSLFYVD